MAMATVSAAPAIALDARRNLMNDCLHRWGEAYPFEDTPISVRGHSKVVRVAGIIEARATFFSLRDLAPGLHFSPHWRQRMKITFLLAAILASFIGLAAPVSIAQAEAEPASSWSVPPARSARAPRDEFRESPSKPTKSNTSDKSVKSDKPDKSKSSLSSNGDRSVPPPEPRRLRSVRLEIDELTVCLELVPIGEVPEDEAHESVEVVTAA